MIEPQVQIERLRDQIAQIESEVECATKHLNALQGRLEGLREALRIVTGEDATTGVTVRKPRPSGTGSRIPDPRRSPAWAFVLDLLASAPPQGYSVDYIIQKIEESEIDMARNTLRSVLSHATKEGVVERVSMGHYRAAAHGLRQTDEPPDTDASGGSEESPSGAAGLPGESPRQGLPVGSNPTASTVRRNLLSGSALPALHAATAERDLAWFGKLPS